MQHSNKLTSGKGDYASHPEQCNSELERHNRAQHRNTMSTRRTTFDLRHMKDRGTNHYSRWPSPSLPSISGEETLLGTPVEFPGQV